MKQDSFACAELSCGFLEAKNLEDCVKRRCPFAWQRSSMEAARIIEVDNGDPDEI